MLHYIYKQLLWWKKRLNSSPLFFLRRLSRKTQSSRWTSFEFLQLDRKMVVRMLGHLPGRKFQTALFAFHKFCVAMLRFVVIAVTRSIRCVATFSLCIQAQTAGRIFDRRWSRWTKVGFFIQFNLILVFKKRLLNFALYAIRQAFQNGAVKFTVLVWVVAFPSHTLCIRFAVGKNASIPFLFTGSLFLSLQFEAVLTSLVLSSVSLLIPGNWIPRFSYPTWRPDEGTFSTLPPTLSKEETTSSFGTFAATSVQVFMLKKELIEGVLFWDISSNLLAEMFMTTIPGYLKFSESLINYFRWNSGFHLSLQGKYLVALVSHSHAFWVADMYFNNTRRFPALRAGRRFFHHILIGLHL